MGFDYQVVMAGSADYPSSWTSHLLRRLEDKVDPDPHSHPKEQEAQGQMRKGALFCVLYASTVKIAMAVALSHFDIVVLGLSVSAE